MKYSQLMLVPQDEYDNLISQSNQLENVHINQLMFNEGEKINVRHDVKGNEGKSQSSVQILNKKKPNKKPPTKPSPEEHYPQPRQTERSHNVDSTHNSTGESTQYANQSVINEMERTQQTNHNQKDQLEQSRDGRAGLIRRLNNMRTQRYHDADGFVRDYMDDGGSNDTVVNNHLNFHWLDDYQQRKKPESNSSVNKVVTSDKSVNTSSPAFVNQSVMTSPHKLLNKQTMTSPLQQKVSKGVSTSPPPTFRDKSQLGSPSNQPNMVSRNITPINERGSNFRASTPQPGMSNDGGSFLARAEQDTSMISSPKTSPGRSRSGVNNSTKKSINDSTKNLATSLGSKNKTFQEIIDSTSLASPLPPKSKSFINKHPHGPRVPRKLDLLQQYKSPARQRIEASAHFNKRALDLVQLGQKNIDEKRKERLNKSLQEKNNPPPVNHATMRRLNESKKTSPALQGSLNKQLTSAMKLITNRVPERGLLPALDQDKVRPSSSVSEVASKLWRNRYEDLTKTNLNVEKLKKVKTPLKKPKRDKRIFPTSVDIDGLPLVKRLRSNKKL